VHLVIYLDVTNLNQIVKVIMKNEKEILANFQMEELEKRYEMMTVGGCIQFPVWG
jgi:hypothetical protein